ncbi:uncharacterized protein TrAtP1_002560 [Trichoderma atroviride]|uniref:uncharacterized protein n=1 Tax=Hypocrea atroviridis TaxID=63577 RepID=UPI0033325BCE|nr:hypothetical protein TrAtP1_002560 [Trichoderma atroviride]
MANGGVNYKAGVLFGAQRTQDRPGGLSFMASRPSYTSHLMLSSFYGRNLNSVNDVVTHSDGSIRFTDPIYGFEPNGICFGPDEKIVYITDTDCIHRDGTTDDLRASHT